MARHDPQVNLRMAADLKQRLDAAAKRSNRTLTAEIAFRLEQTFSIERYNSDVEARLARGEPPFDDIPQPESMDDYGHVRTVTGDEREVVEIDSDQLQRVIDSVVRSAISDMLGLASGGAHTVDELTSSIEQMAARGRKARAAKDQISKLADKEYPPFKPQFVGAPKGDKAKPAVTAPRANRATKKRQG